MRMHRMPRSRTWPSRWGRRLAADSRGSAALLFALTFSASTVAALLAIDLTRASTMRSQLQDALDAATLAAAVSRTNDPAEIDRIGDRFLAAQFQEPGVKSVSATFTPTATAVVAVATANVEPFFADAVIKSAYIPVRASAEVLRDYDSTDTEVVMVLDTTASMAGAKMTTLKTAAKNLVNKVTESADSKIRIGVVPFAQYVNIGVSRRNKPWVSVPADSSKTTTTPAKCTDIKSRTTCATPAKSYSCTKYNDGVPYQGTCYTAASNCSTTYYNAPYAQQCTPAKTTTSTSKFYGCVGSPAYPKNVRDDDPARVYPGFMNLTCTTELTPLTASKPTVIAAIDALATYGETYIPSGLAWGFNALSKAEPLNEAAAYDATGRNMKPRKVLVLMTDGENTIQMNASNGMHNVSATPATQANNYTTELCSNIRAAKIEVFTIAFSVTNAATKTMLQGCASDPQHYFDATDSAALSAAFQTIADALRVIRISK